MLRGHTLPFNRGGAEADGVEKAARQGPQDDRTRVHCRRKKKRRSLKLQQGGNLQEVDRGKKGHSQGT